MTVWKFLNRFLETPSQRADRLIRETLRTSSLPVADLGDGMRAVVAPPRNTYRSRVYVWAYGGAIRCQAATDIAIERNWVGREVAIQLLEANLPGLPGVFSLVPDGDERIVVLGTEVDARETTAAELRKLIDDLLVRFERMVARLYAMDLIIAGPEPFSSAPSGR